MNPFVFIVGCPRSGTTLLQRVVDAHPKIAVMPEAPWIYQLLGLHGGSKTEGTVPCDLVAALSEHPKFVRLGITPDQLLTLIGEDKHIAYPTLVSQIFALYGAKQGKDLVGNKTPGLVRRLEVVHELWPEARVIHLIRDGRDIFLSMKSRPLHSQDFHPLAGWSEALISTVALWWELNVRMGRKAGNSMGPGLYYEVIYESLVKYPIEVCMELCAFLGISYSGSMVHFHETAKTKKSARPITPGVRDWRTQMPAEDVELFESAAGKMLTDLGYPRAFPHPSPEMVERSARMRDLLLAKSPRYAGAYAGVEAHP